MELTRIGVVGGVFLGAILVRLFSRGRLLRGVAKSIIYSFILISMNMVLPMYAVAINLYTLGVAIILGFPGIMTLFLLKSMIV